MAVEYVPKEQSALDFMALTGKERKDAGMKKAAKRRNHELEYAQWVAGVIGMTQDTVTIEDVREQFEREKRPWTLANAAGSVFRGETHLWEFAGWQNAKHPQAHARPIRVWRLK